MLAAIKYGEGQCDKIILTRPAVGDNDEQHELATESINQKQDGLVL